MFDSVGWGEILVLVIAGLFILGPERLPEAAAWLGRTIRQVRNYATGATEQLRGEFGTDFDEIRKPLEELRSLRNFNPRTAATNMLFGDDDAAATGSTRGDANGNGNGAKPNLTKGPDLDRGPRNMSAPQANGSAPRVEKPAPQPQLTKNERPPIDPDAT